MHDQATEDISGTEEHVSTNDPSANNLDVFGITPLLVNSLSMDNGTPSRPIITSRFGFILLFQGDYAAGADVLAFDENKSA
jgi:hypothetical protein